MGKQWKQWEALFLRGGSKIIADDDYSHEIKRRLLLGRKVMTNLDSMLKNRDITLPTKVCLVKAMLFFCSHVWMWELDHKESWAPKNWCLWTLVLEKTLESPLDSKEIKLVHFKGDFILKKPTFFPQLFLFSYSDLRKTHLTYISTTIT